MPTLKVFVNEAADLFGADLDGKSDPYCVLKIGEGNQFSAIEKTRKIKNTKNPTWKECFTLNVNNPLTESLFLEVWNKEKSKDDSLGYAQIPLHDLQRNVEKQVWVQLEGGTTGSNIIGSIASHLGKKKGEKTNHGKVFLGLTALDFGIDPNFAQQQFQQGMGMHQGMPMQQGMGMPGIQQGMGQGMQSGIGTQHCATHGIHDQCHTGNMQQGMGQGIGQGMGMQQPGMQQGFQPGMGQGMGMQQPGMQQGFQPGMGQGVHQHPISSGGHEGTKSKEGVPIHPPSSGGVQGSKGEHGASIHPPSSGGLEGSKRVNTPQVPSTTATSTTTHPPGVLKPESQYHGTAQDL